MPYIHDIGIIAKCW